MPEVFVAKAAQFPDGERRIVAQGGREIGVFHWQGKFYAYENLCVHQGGPACEGIMMHKVEDVARFRSQLARPEIFGRKLVWFLSLAWL